jgi:hypothetical protein
LIKNPEQISSEEWYRLLNTIPHRFISHEIYKKIMLERSKAKEREKAMREAKEEYAKLKERPEGNL